MGNTGFDKSFSKEEGIKFDKLPDFGDSNSIEMFKSATSNSQVERAVSDTTWAGSAVPNEIEELKRLMEPFIEEKEDFVFIQKYFQNYGFDPVTIRKVFKEITEIDPVEAYLDVSFYEKPPASVPMYNYGWGASKSKDYDYYYILPFASKISIWGLAGFDQSVVESFDSVGDAREKLKKLVKDVKDVTPESGTTVFDIIQKASALSDHGKELWNILKESKFHDLNKKAAIDAYADGDITEGDFNTISELIKISEETIDPAQRAFEKEYMSYRDKMEHRSIDQVDDEINIPESKLDQVVEEESRFDLLEITSQGYETIKNIAQDLANYTIDVIGTSGNAKDFEGYGMEDSKNHSYGSVSFIVNIIDGLNQREAKAVLVMFVKDGGIQYSGKFKGTNDREYAFTEEGIASYMSDKFGEEAIQHTPSPAVDMSTAPTSLSTYDNQVGPNIR